MLEIMHPCLIIKYLERKINKESMNRPCILIFLVS
jgi:hypothetical protein